MTLDEAYEIKVGDYVMVKDDEYTINDEPLKESKLLVVEDDTVKFETLGYRINSTKVERQLIKDFPEDFTKVEDKYFSGGLLGEQPKERAEGQLGVYRPKLETRKVGKVRVELVDKGFPNALWELAKLMTKAQEVKGYADHDWKNLPNAEQSFPSAASRHRMKHNMGEIYDDEFESEDFKMYHKVNEAFNVLAELELILTGKIKP